MDGSLTWENINFQEGYIRVCQTLVMFVIFECGQFRMVLAEKYHEYQTNVGYYDINCFVKEVIGNIHDNPTILKGGGDNG